MQGTLQKYVDDFFKNMLSACPYVPPVIKYLFDFLDHQAQVYGIADPEVVHTWKCNRSVTLSCSHTYLTLPEVVHTWKCNRSVTLSCSHTDLTLP